MQEPNLIPCPLRKWATRRPEGVFLCLGERQVTFAEAETWLDSTPGEAEAGTPLCTGTRDVPLLVERLLKGLRAGGVLGILNDRLPPETLARQSRWLRDVWPAGTAGRPGSARRMESPMWDLAAPATILFTSGSGGRPKAIVHTAGNHWASAVAANRQAPLGEMDRWLCPMPLYHVGGLAILFRCLEAGARMCLPDPEWSLAEAVRRLSPTRISLVPTQLRRWLRDSRFDPSGVERVLMGGAPLPGDLARAAVERGVPLAASYGMTETASQVAATPPGREPRGSGCPLDHAEIRIAADSEIQVRGRSVAVGELTEEGIQPLTDMEGWLRTRDRGRIERGVLQVEGRMDRMFISGGENIQPERVERALMALPNIGTAVVVPFRDSEFGDRPAAWVEAEVSASSVAEWNRRLRQNLPGYLIPVRYRVLPEPPGLKPDLEALTRGMNQEF